MKCIFSTSMFGLVDVKAKTIFGHGIIQLEVSCENRIEMAQLPGLPVPKSV